MGSPTPPARGARLIGCRDREKGGREGGAGRLGAPRPPPLQESGPRRAPPPRRPPLEQRPEAPRAPDVPGRGRPAAGAWGPQRPGRGAPRSRARSPAAPAAPAPALRAPLARSPNFGGRAALWGRAPGAPRCARGPVAPAWRPRAVAHVPRPRVWRCRVPARRTGRHPPRLRRPEPRHPAGASRGHGASSRTRGGEGDGKTPPAFLRHAPESGRLGLRPSQAHTALQPWAAIILIFKMHELYLNLKKRGGGRKRVRSWQRLVLGVEVVVRQVAVPSRGRRGWRNPLPSPLGTAPRQARGPAPGTCPGDLPRGARLRQGSGCL